MPTVFERIISGEIPSYTVYQDDIAHVILDIHPYSYGHSLVIPTKPVDSLFDLPDTDYVHMWKMVKVFSPALVDLLQCERMGVMVEGREVPHAHIHMIPLYPHKPLCGERMSTDHASLQSLHATLLTRLSELSIV